MLAGSDGGGAGRIASSSDYRRYGITRTFLEVTSQEILQADVARKYGVDVSVIIRLSRNNSISTSHRRRPARLRSPISAALGVRTFLLVSTPTAAAASAVARSAADWRSCVGLGRSREDGGDDWSLVGLAAGGGYYAVRVGPRNMRG